MWSAYLVGLIRGLSESIARGVLAHGRHSRCLSYSSLICQWGLESRHSVGGRLWGLQEAPKAAIPGVREGIWQKSWASERIVLEKKLDAPGDSEIFDRKVLGDAAGGARIPPWCSWNHSPALVVWLGWLLRLENLGPDPFFSAKWQNGYFSSAINSSAVIDWDSSVNRNFSPSAIQLPQEIHTERQVPDFLFTSFQNTSLTSILQRWPKHFFLVPLWEF